MDDRTEQKNNISICVQGARCCISVGKGVIRALGCPSHITFKVSDSNDSISIFPCDEDDIMSFKVPDKLLRDHKCVMRINSKKFVHGILRYNELDITKTYYFPGEYLDIINTAVFPLTPAAV